MSRWNHNIHYHPFMLASVAALHHMDAEAGLARMAALVRPGANESFVG